MTTLPVEEDSIEASRRESENDAEEYFSPTWRSSFDDESIDNKDHQRVDFARGTSVADGSSRSLGPVIEEIELKSSWRSACIKDDTIVNWRWRTISTVHAINDDTEMPTNAQENTKYINLSLCIKPVNSLVERLPLSEGQLKEVPLPLQSIEAVDDKNATEEESDNMSSAEAPTPLTPCLRREALGEDEGSNAHDLAAEALMLMADALDSTPDLPSDEEATASSVRVSMGPSPREQESWSCLSRQEQEFLNDGVELERAISERKLDEADRKGLTPLQRAAMRGHGAFAELLLGLGADPNRTGGTGADSDCLRAPVPPVALALQAGHVEIAEALFERGATLDWYDKNSGQVSSSSSGFQWWGRWRR